jgi:hypothetical protein
MYDPATTLDGHGPRTASQDVTLNALRKSGTLGLTAVHAEANGERPGAAADFKPLPGGIRLLSILGLTLATWAIVLVLALVVSSLVGSTLSHASSHAQADKGEIDAVRGDRSAAVVD